MSHDPSLKEHMAQLPAESTNTIVTSGRIAMTWTRTSNDIVEHYSILVISIFPLSPAVSVSPAAVSLYLKSYRIVEMWSLFSVKTPHT